MFSKLIRLACPVLILTAVTTAAQPSRNISGTISDTKGARIAEAVVLAQRSSDSAVLKTAISGQDGRYSIAVAEAGAILIKATATGYEDQTMMSNAGPQGDSVLNFTLKETSAGLGTVTVTARKPLIEHKIDRTIFNVSASISATGGTAYDAMKKAPAVIVKESDNSITIAGKSSAQVMLNGRLLQLSGEDLTAYLQAIPSDNVERIEVITTPPAQYDAAGNSGLINIVLKKNRAVGFNGSARAGYEQSTYGTGIGGAVVNYRKGRLNIYGNGNYSNGAKHNVERLTTPYPDQLFRLEDPYKKQTSNLQYTAGADFDMNKNHVLGVQFNSTAFVRHDAGNTDVFVEARPGGNIDSVLHTANTASANRHTNILNLNYVWTIDTTGKKISINANKLWYDDARHRDFETTNFNGLFISPTGIAARDKNLGSQAVNITTAQVDAELPYKWASLSLGGKLSFVENNSGNDFLYFANGNYVNDPAISNAFSYKEAVQALYASAQKEAGEWSFQAGLRAEATQTKGYSPTLNQTNTSKYVNLFPTAYVSYKPGENHVLTLTYNKRINRPGYADLNPFRIYTTPYLYNEGNPYLAPSYDHTVSLDYTLKQNYTLSAFYEFEASHFGLVFGSDPVTKASFTTHANIGDFRAYGLSASATVRPAKWWELQGFANGGVQEIHVPAGTAPKPSYSLPALYVSANNSFTVNRKKTLMAELNIWYLSSSQQDLFYSSGMGSVDTGFKAVLMDKRLVVSLTATDIFGTQLSRSVNQVTGQALNSYFDQRNVRIMLNYKFGSDKVKAQRERSTGLEDEKRRT